MSLIINCPLAFDGEKIQFPSAEQLSKLFQMFRKIFFGYPGSFCIVFFILSQLIPDIPAQSKDKTTNWPAPKFEHITVSDGLPSNDIICMLQDHLGYLWFGSPFQGLIKYDGYKMTTYSPIYGNQSSLSDLNVSKLYEDRSGQLWIGTGQMRVPQSKGGLNLFDRRTDTFTRFMHNPDDSTSINSNIINDICEDQKGNLWVATDKGLNLVNKQKNHFRRFKMVDSAYTEDVYNYFIRLKNRGKIIGEITKVGNIANLTKTFTLTRRTDIIVTVMGESTVNYGWIEDKNGRMLFKYDFKESVCAGSRYSTRIEIKRLTLNAGLYRLRYVSAYNYSYQNWLGHGPAYLPDFSGIRVFVDEQKTLNFSTKKIKPPLNIYSMVAGDSSYPLYLLTASGILGFNSNTGTFRKLFTDIGEFGSQSNGGKLYKSNDGTIWIGSQMGLVRFNPQSNRVKLYQIVTSYNNYLPDNDLSIASVIEYRGFIWSGCRNGNLICFNPHNAQFHIYKSDPDNRRSLSQAGPYGILEVFKDRSEDLWVSTADFGLNKWNPNKTKFNSYNYDDDKKKKLGNNEVMSMIEAKSGLIWIGTRGGGLVSFDRTKNEFIHYLHIPGNQNSLIGNSVMTICEDPDEAGVFWIGTENKGMDKFDSRNSSFTHYQYDPNVLNSISNNRVFRIYTDEKGYLWIGNDNGGLNRFDIKTHNFVHFRSVFEDSTSLSSDAVRDIYRDRAGNLWIGTFNDWKGRGLNRFYSDSGSVKSFSANERNWRVPYVDVIYEDKKGNFWIGDYINGLFLFDRSKEKYVMRFSQKEGLANNQVLSMLEDDKGYLWIGTYNGLSRFDPAAKSFKNYYKDDGLSSNKFFFNCAFKSRTGEFYFGGENGFTWFNPEDIKDDPETPQVVISKVSLFNRPEDKLKFDGFISEMKELDLSYDENDLRFDYVGLQFADPAKNRYKYKLEGFDKDWVDAGTQRNATYTNLEAGEYIFKVTACNEDGVWNEEGASIRIIIPPPFWATWWAYGFYLIVFGSVLYGIRKYEMNRLNWKNQSKLDEVKLKEREETDRMKSRFFANISHEFRTPLTLILGPTEKVLTESEDNETQKQLSIVKRSANRLLGLINQLLDLSKLEAGKLELNASKGNIISFIKGITMSFESAAERKDIMLNVKADKNEIELYFDKEKMAKIMTNLLSNAFKFTGDGGEITVTINEKENSFVEIKVKDTGIGISEEELSRLFDRFYQADNSQTREHEGTGIGLALTKELVELHRGTIKVNSSLGKWSEFIIELPVGREHLTDTEIVETEEEVKPEIVFDEGEYISTAAGVIERTEIPDEDKNIILIVEDNRDVREFIKDSIGDEFETEEASNGEQGFNKAEKFIPDLIISDIMMPKMDGNELTRRIKNDEKTSHIPVILLTARSEQESRLEGLETGADDYLIKPFDSKELRIRIKNLIDIRKKLREKYINGDYIWKQDKKQLSSLDEQYMSKVLEIIHKYLSEEEFDIETFNKEMGLGRVQNYRKLKALTGCSPSRYIRKIRLMKAREMIREKKGNISEIAYSVGFSSPAYFTRCFKEEFGYSPSKPEK